MKHIFFIIGLLFYSLGLSQEWRTEYDNAKKLYENGNYVDAYKGFVKAQQQAPENIDISKEISNSAYRKGDYKEAKESYYNQAQNAESPTEKADMYHNMGNCSLKEKNYQDAITNYKNALKLNPKSQETRYNLAEAKRRLKKEQKKNSENKDDQNQNQGENNKNQDSEGQNKDQSKSSEDSKQNNDQNQNKSNQNKDQKNSSNNSSSQADKNRDKLSNKKTERLLDDLMKQEMKTKRKVRGRGRSNKEATVKSGKRW